MNDKFLIILLGLYSRGKSQILRMACIIEIMNKEMAKTSDDIENWVTEVFKFMNN